MRFHPIYHGGPCLKGLLICALVFEVGVWGATAVVRGCSLLRERALARQVDCLWQHYIRGEASRMVECMNEVRTCHEKVRAEHARFNAAQTHVGFPCDAVSEVSRDAYLTGGQEVLEAMTDCLHEGFVLYGVQVVSQDAYRVAEHNEAIEKGVRLGEEFLAVWRRD